MSYTAKVKIQFDSKFEYLGSSFSNDMLPEEHITMEIPAEDLNVHQYFRFFKNFLLAIGHSEQNISRGACGLAFSEENDEDMMKRVANEYEIILMEDFAQRLEDEIAKAKDIDNEWAKINQPELDVWEKRYWQLKRFVNENLDKEDEKFEDFSEQ
jgi:hypothetical protein